MDEQAVTIGLAALVVLGVVAQWVGRRLGFASLLLLLPAGLLAGSLGLVEPEELFGDTLFPLTTTLVALLLFQSGLALRFDALPKEARTPVGRLVTIGALVTFAGASAGALAIVGVDRNLAFLIGAILVVSGPTVVGPLLEVIRARHPTAAVLRWEGVMLDPLGATLGVVVLNVVLAAGRGGVHPVFQMLARLGVGIAIGLVAAGALVFVMSRFLVTDNMEPAVAVAFAVAAHASSEVLLSEAGLIAAVTLGVAAANQQVVPTRRILGFGETLEVLIIGVLFILLGALVEVDQLVALAGRASAFVALLVVVVRPLSVAIGLAGTSMQWRDRALIGWVDPRGIVAGATATQFSGELTAAGFDADPLGPVTFAVILGTGVVYSLTAPIAARMLQASDPPPTGVALMGHADWLFSLGRALCELEASVVLITSRQSMDGLSVGSVRVVPIHESEDELDAVLDGAGVGQALVATEAGVMRTLVLASLVEVLGRRHVYRLPDHEEPAMPRLLAERWIPRPFAPGVTLTGIDKLMRAGGAVTIIGGDTPDDALPMAVVHEDGSVDLAPGLPRAGWRRRSATPVGAIALVRPQPRSQKA